MSNLQTLARRCPVMGKALAISSARSGKLSLGGVSAIKARAYTGKASAGKARLHTSRVNEATAAYAAQGTGKSSSFSCMN